MPKLNPEELREIARDLDDTIESHSDILKAEPKLRQHMIDARDEANKRFHDVGETREVSKAVH